MYLRFLMSSAGIPRQSWTFLRAPELHPSAICRVASSLQPRGHSLPSNRLFSSYQREIHHYKEQRREYHKSIALLKMATGRADAEKEIKRNPHGDFKAVEASRPPFDKTASFHYTQTPKPDWKPGSGANHASSEGKSHRSIEPYEQGRPVVHNYKMLISAIVPRPIGFVSTISGDGQSTNLAPFSYFNLVNHDPPMFVLGFAGGLDRAKDTLKNLLDTKEATINIISEDYVEAANFTSINAPIGVSEWSFSGLHAEKSKIVRPDRVKEAVFSIEAKLVSTTEWTSKNPDTPGKKTGVTAFVEGVNFWAREDAIDEQGVLVDPAVLKPISRLGGITYGRTTQAFELPRPDYDEVTKDPEVKKLAKPKGESQL